MNNKLYPKSINNNSIRLSDISAYREYFNFDPQQTSISLRIINGMTFSFNWTTGKFNCSHHA